MIFLVSCYQALLDILLSPHLHILNLLHPHTKRRFLILPRRLLVRELLPKSAYLPPFLFEQQVHSFQASASGLRDEEPRPQASNDGDDGEELEGRCRWG